MNRKNHFESLFLHLYRVSSIVDDTPENKKRPSGEGMTWSAYLYDISEIGYPKRIVEMFSERGKGTLIAKKPNSE